jgi:hypothetical protein
VATPTVETGEQEEAACSVEPELEVEQAVASAPENFQTVCLEIAEEKYLKPTLEASERSSDFEDDFLAQPGASRITESRTKKLTPRTSWQALATAAVILRLPAVPNNTIYLEGKQV